MTPTTKLAISLPLSLLCFCFILTAFVRSQSKKCLQKSTNSPHSNLNTMNLNMSSVVDEVPETEASMGRELDH